MSETSPLPPLNAESRPDQIFPALNAEQLARISAQGTKRQLGLQEVVYEAGAEEVPFVVGDQRHRQGPADVMSSGIVSVNGPAASFR